MVDRRWMMEIGKWDREALNIQIFLIFNPIFQSLNLLIFKSFDLAILQSCTKDPLDNIVIP